MSSSTTATNSTTSTREPWAPTAQYLGSAAQYYAQHLGQPASFTPNSTHQGGLQQMQALGQADNYGQTKFDRNLASEQYLPGMMGQAQAGYGTGSNVLGNQANYGDAGLIGAGNTAYGNMQRAQGLGDISRNTGGNWADWYGDKSGGSLQDQYANTNGVGSWQDWYADKSNPYLDQVIQDANNDAMRSIKSQFTGLGRNIGSGAFGDVAADRLGKIATQARMQDYANERGMYEQAHARERGIDVSLRNMYEQMRANERGMYEQAQSQGRQLGQGYEQLGQGFNTLGLNAAAQNAALQGGAAGNLYSGGANQMLQGASQYDNTARQQIADNWEVAKDATGLLHAGDTGLNSILDYPRQAYLQSISFPGQGLQALGSAFGTGVSFGSATQPNTGLIPGIASTGLGLLGGGLF